MEVVIASRSRVYVIGDPSTDGPCKIGTTIDLRGRLAAIKTGNGAILPDGINRGALEILYDYPGDRRLETELHRYNARHRLVGEWFDITPDEARNVVFCYLSDRGTLGAIRERGIACGCVRCQFLHPPEQRPGSRPEWDCGDHRLVHAVHAMTHARLGVDFCDEDVSLPASHCDLDRALRLLEVLDSDVRRSTVAHRVADLPSGQGARRSTAVRRRRLSFADWFRAQANRGDDIGVIAGEFRGVSHARPCITSADVRRRHAELMCHAWVFDVLAEAEDEYDRGWH